MAMEVGLKAEAAVTKYNAEHGSRQE